MVLEKSRAVMINLLVTNHLNILTNKWKVQDNVFELLILSEHQFYSKTQRYPVSNDIKQRKMASVQTWGQAVTPRLPDK